MALMVLTAGIMALSPSVAHAQKIAWLDLNRVLKGSKTGKRFLRRQKRIQRQFDDERRQLQQPLMQEEQSLQQEWNQLQRQQQSLGKEEFSRKLQAFKRKYDNHMKKVNALNQKLMKLQNKYTKKFQNNVLAPFNRKLKKVAAKLARQKGYTYILVHDPNNPQLFVYASPSLDVTGDIIRLLDSSN